MLYFDSNDSCWREIDISDQSHVALEWCIGTANERWWIVWSSVFSRNAVSKAFDTSGIIILKVQSRQIASGIAYLGPTERWM